MGRCCMTIRRSYDLSCDSCDATDMFLCEPPYAGWFEYEGDRFVCKPCAKRLVSKSIGPAVECVLPVSTHDLYCEHKPPCIESLRVAAVGNPMEDLASPSRRAAVLEQLSKFGWVVTTDGRVLCKEHK